MAVIKESYVLTASNTDVLAAPSRLAAIPQDGVLTLEMAASASDTSNYFLATLQLPSGETPFEDLTVPYNGYAAANVIHDDTALQVELEVEAGGHVTLSLAETGTSTCLIYATLSF